MIWRWALHWQILLGLAVGALCGLAVGRQAVARAFEEQPDFQRAQRTYAELLAAEGVSDTELAALRAAAARADAEPDDLLRLHQAEARRAAFEGRHGHAQPRPPALLAGQHVRDSWHYVLFKLVGDLFIRGLMLIIVPLVTSSIALAILSIGSAEHFGRLGGKTLLYYLCTSLLAILVGLVLVNLVVPGSANGVGILAGRDLSVFADAQQQVQARAGDSSAADFLNVFRQMIPPNIVQAAAEGQLLGLIVVSLLVGFVLSRMQGPPREVLENFVQAVHDISLTVTHVVLAVAPLGVLGLLATTLAEQYASLYPDDRFHDFLGGIGKFAGTALAALLVHFGVTMPLILLVLGRVNPLRHYRAMAPALMTAFSTASSAATLPVTLECVEKRAGVSRKTCGFALPLGATVNMDGTALYECVAVMFICQAFGVDLTFAQQFMIVVTALLTSVGVAGVPAASLVAIIIILQAVQVQLPPEAPALILGLGLLFVFDRPLDMCRTAVNVFGDSCGAVVIGRSEGETQILKGQDVQAAMGSRALRER
jgi:Na+/H+-dicarboxylate symporter